MSSLNTLQDINVKNKTVLCRVDLNVPIKNGRVIDKTRITRLVPTFEYLLKHNAKVVVLSHFGRPEGEYHRELSLAPITNALSEALHHRPVQFAVDCIGSPAKEAIAKLQPGEILLLENLRFYPGEEKNDPDFTKALAELGEIYINDTFSCSHRSHASIVGITKLLPSAAGLLLQEEIDNLELIFEKPERPVAAIVGGSKISTKLGILENLIHKVNFLIIGGAMANTFLKAEGKGIGKSLYEKDMLDKAVSILKSAKQAGCEIILPEDGVVAEELKEHPKCRVVAADKVPEESMILDIGPKTVSTIIQTIQACRTLVWNGPLGAFEFKPFDAASIVVARQVAKQTAEKKLISVAGGGDVVACLEAACLADGFSYISTAGGAFLEWLEGKELPGIIPLKKIIKEKQKAG